MTSTPFFVALAAGSLLAAAPATPAVVAAPIRYKVVIESKQVVDLSALSQPNQELSQVATTFFQLAVSDSAGGHVLHLVIDSLVPDEKARAQIPAPILDSAKGATYHIVLDPKGTLGVKALKAGGPLATAFASTISEFVPRISGALQAGREWSDTAETSREIPSGALKSKTVTNYKVIGAESAGTKVNAAFAASQSGAQETPGGTADLAGTSTGTASWVLAADKSIVSAERKEEVKLTVTIAAAPAPIPITQTQSATLVRVP